MIESERVSCLRDLPPDRHGRFVLYWMQQSQRAAMNPALEYAARQANDLNVPLIVGFALMSDYPEATERHYAFMLEGLAETQAALRERGVKMIARLGSPPIVIAALAGDAATVVCDKGYLRHQRKWREQLAEHLDKRIVEVEGDVVVPVETASDKREWAARTIRKKINAHRKDYLRGLSATKLEKSSLSLRRPVIGELQLADRHVLETIQIDRSVPPSTRFTGGTTAARRRLTRFLRNGLHGYADARNDPAQPQASQLSPYLHFGQISPVEIALKVSRAKGGRSADKEAFLEELIVRRELAINFVYYTPDYDKFSCLPDWAQHTLMQHRNDERPARYTRAEMEAAETHDPYWNAATREMVLTGYMHNYMRMYWGKKILEWCNTPEYAYSTALYLNNKYFIDGRDANSYTNVAWLFGLHDRPWGEREVFGSVRYMSAAGLERKFDIDQYVRWVESLK